MVLNTMNYKNILIRILKDIYTDNSLGPFLGFKGGTALYFFYNLNRFSLDLDFDLLDEKKEKEVFEKIENIIGKYGEIKKKINKRNIIFFLISYAKEDKNIKIEINKRNFNSQYEIKNYLGISILVMKIEDMFAHKLVSLLERGKLASRDIYDIYFFLKNDFKINKEIVEKRTKMKFSEYLKKCIKFLEKISNNIILSGIGELINHSQKNWIKLNLKKEIIFLLNLMLENEKEK